MDEKEVEDQVITLDRGHFTTCTIHLHGGIITSWRIKNAEQLYMSTQSIIHYTRHIPGGISYSFPYVGVRTFGAETGFLGKILWYVKEEPMKHKNKDVSCVIAAKDTPYTNAIKNFSWRVEVKIRLCESELKTELRLINEDKHMSVNFQLLQNLSLYKPNVFDIDIGGLGQCRKEEFGKILPELFFRLPVNEQITNKVYFNTPDEFYILNELTEDKLKITKKNQPQIHMFSVDPTIDETSLNRNYGDYRECLHARFGDFISTIILPPQKQYSVELNLERITLEDEDTSYLYVDVFKNVCDPQKLIKK